jgi:hypothetical protein
MVMTRRFAFRAAAGGDVVAQLFARLPRKAVIDGAQLSCAVGLFAAPFWFALPPAPSWNLWIAGYAMLTCTVAALVAEAEWEPEANLTLGVWLLVAPWLLGFPHDTVAMLVHVAGGTVAAVLSVFELRRAEDSPPRRFGPAAARRQEMVSVVRAVTPAACARAPVRARRHRRATAGVRPREGASARMARVRQLGARSPSGASFETSVAPR